MKRNALLATALTITAMTASGFTADERQIKSDIKAKKAPVDKLTDGAVEVDSKTADKRSDKNEVNEKITDDEKSIRDTGESYVAAFCAGDASKAAAHFTTDAEYVDPNGNVYRGRKEIEELLTSLFAAKHSCKLQLEIESIRVISPGVAIEDGIIAVETDEKESETCTYTAVHVKQGDKWLTASVRDTTVDTPRHHRTQLAQLEWLLGDWVHEGDDAMVRFSCHHTEDGNFLIRNFSVNVEGQEMMNGTQRIAWDAHAKKFRTWVFDSDGGFGEGSWHRDGQTWTLKLHGVTAEGQTASSTSRYTIINDRTMTFSSVDHEVNGVKLEDSEPVTIVRESPLPESAGSN